MLNWHHLFLTTVIVVIVVVVLGCGASVTTAAAAAAAVDANSTPGISSQIIFSRTDPDQQEPPIAWKLNKRGLRLPRDEFNSTETLFKHPQFISSGPTERLQVASVLKKVLLRYNLSDCCPAWSQLNQNNEIQEEQRRIGGKNHKLALRPQDLLAELKQASFNITYLSIDGQAGESHWEKYYKFYDDVHYYLRLMIVAKRYLRELAQRTAPGANESQSSGSPAEVAAKQRKQLEDIDLKRQFERQIRSIHFKVSREPTISSFLRQLLPSISMVRPENFTPDSLVVNENFDLYETFISYTEFGQTYARNISMLGECVQIFDLICAHLTQVNFPSNLTRPSKQYEILRRMSQELYRIRHNLLENINLRILNQHPDVRRIFNKLNDLVAERPEIRMLGDEFDSVDPNQPSEADPSEFSQSVKKLTYLLDRYTINNFTHLDFYNQLAELPEDFILLGLAVAHEYETKELPQYNRFFYKSDLSIQVGKHDSDMGQNNSQSNSNTSAASLDSARHSERPFLSKLIFG